jgi:hypothetical protein
MKRPTAEIERRRASLRKHSEDLKRPRRAKLPVPQTNYAVRQRLAFGKLAKNLGRTD